MVLSHSSCNNDKNDRLPRPCEVMFGQFVGEIVISALTKKQRKA